LVDFNLFYNSETVFHFPVLIIYITYRIDGKQHKSEIIVEIIEKSETIYRVFENDDSKRNATEKIYWIKMIQIVI
jgi:methyltransferase-like protein